MAVRLLLQELERVDMEDKGAMAIGTSSSFVGLGIRADASFSCP